MKNSLGKVVIKPRGIWYKAMQKLRLAPVEVELYLETYTSKKSYDIANILSGIDNILSKDPAAFIDAISESHTKMVDLIALAASTSRSVPKDVLVKSIDEGWQPDQFVSAIQTIISNIDYDSYIGMMTSIGKLKVS